MIGSILSNVTTSAMPPRVETTAPFVDTTVDATTIVGKAQFAASMKTRRHTRHVLLLTGYGIMAVWCFIMVFYLHCTRAAGIKHTKASTRRPILSAFKPLLVALGLFAGAFTVFLGYALGTDMFEYSVSKVTTEAFYCARQFVFLSVLVFMLQTSVSLPALWRSTAITLVLSVYTLPIAWVMADYGDPSDFYAVITSSRAAMLLLYGFVFVRPPCRASKRAVREFCAYVFIYYALLFTYNELLRQSKLELGFNLTYITAIWAVLYPLVVFRVLTADTAHWRGNGERSLLMQPLLRQNDSIPERAASKGFHELLEMHRSNVVDIADLTLEKRCAVGSGTNIEWIGGIFQSEIPIALKVFTPPIFTDACIADVAYEAAICSALQHPNIVKFYGICVSPPTIGLVLELCEGSLEEVICVASRRTQHPNRQQLMINVAYMLDATRAVAHMHSFSPAFLHRNIKPSSFVVDAENNVKLTNFGDTRSLPSSEDSNSQETCANQLTTKGSVYYMAPEMINSAEGQATYDEAVDVFALAMTMWDILNPGQEKYPAHKGNHPKIYECVSQGQRPDLRESLHPELCELLEAAWHADPRKRPSAHNLVNMLVSIQEQLAAELVLRLRKELDRFQIIKGDQGVGVVTFTGASVLKCMEQQGYVVSRSEGIRLGNALLDAYIVHPLKGPRRFEGNSGIYYCDEDNINLNEPLHGFKLRTLETCDCEDDDA